MSSTIRDVTGPSCLWYLLPRSGPYGRSAALVISWKTTWLIRIPDSSLARDWAAGDVAALEKELLSAFNQSPEIYDRLLVERNRNWLPQVDACLQENAGCFIVVGAAHLVGRDGLPTLLEKRGYRVTQQ